MKIFSGTTNKPLARKVAKLLGKDLSPIEIYVFQDEEKRVRIEENVIGQDCVVVQSVSTNADKNYMEFFFIVDALRRSGAKNVTAVLPYVGYERQDHVFREGEAVSMDVIIKIIESLGVDKLMALDLHSSRIPELFHIPITHLSALPIFAKTIKDNNWNDQNTILVSPDMGGIRRVKKLSELLNSLPYIAIEKDRNLATGKISMKDIEKTTKKRAIIVDDMISTGGTIAEAAKILVKNGVEEVFVFATHAVFAGDAVKILQDSDAQKIFVTDTIDIPKEKQFAKLEILSVASLIAENIKAYSF